MQEQFSVICFLSRRIISAIYNPLKDSCVIRDADFEPLEGLSQQFTIHLTDTCVIRDSYFESL